jgi:hypothetical protein
MKIGKLVAVAGLTYAVDSVARAVSEVPGTALFLTAIGVILILIFGFFDWTYYDDVIRITLVVIGWVYLAAVFGLFMAGWWGLAFSAVILLYIVMQAGQPVVSSFLGWWDTPERRFEQRMEEACGYEYNFSPTDGYCHFDHEHYEDLLTTDNPKRHGYVERKVPPSLSGDGPSEGALANIQLLKEQAGVSSARPDGFLGSRAWVWWIVVPAIIGWTIKKLFGMPRKSRTDGYVGNQIARYRRPGFQDPRQREIERRMRDYIAGRTTKF